MQLVLKLRNTVSGTPISQLDRTKMGCVTFPVWIGIVTGTVILFLLISIVVINRKWEAIKFFLFMRFNYLVNDDVPEDVDNLEFDSFVIYR